MTWFQIIPPADIDRSITRDQYKAISRWCRIATNLVADKLSEHFRNKRPWNR